MLSNFIQIKNNQLSEKVLKNTAVGEHANRIHDTGKNCLKEPNF